MAGTVIADTVQAASTSQLVIKNGVASTPPTFQDSAGTAIGTLCRAWANYNGSTQTIKASFNVSSVTRNAAGDFTINFSTAMPDANFATQLSIDGGIRHIVIAQTTTSAQVYTYNTGGTLADVTGVYVSIFR